jgi:hypothetical protein
MKIMEYQFKMGHGRFFPHHNNLALDPFQRKSNPVLLSHVILRNIILLVNPDIRSDFF